MNKYNDHMNRKQIKTTFYISIMISILLLFVVGAGYNTIKLINNYKTESEWSFILSVLENNEDKANIQANLVKNDIIKDINTSYKDNKIQLKYDLDNMNTNNELSKIFDSNIRGKYINIDNDNNDIFVLSTWGQNNIDINGRIIYDKSFNCAIYGDTRSFDTELSMHYNYNIAYNSLKNIIDQNKEKPIVWEYLSSTNPNHKKIDYGTLSELKEVYIKEGIEGLKTYEVLNPVYINDKDDVLGTDVITNSGLHNQDNRQFVLVQGFSLYDALNSTSDMNKLIDIINKYTILGNVLEASVLFIIVLFFQILVSISKVQNMSSKLEELQANKDHE